MKNSILLLALVFASSASVLAQARYVTVSITVQGNPLVPQTNMVAIAVGEIAELMSYERLGTTSQDTFFLDVIKDEITFSFTPGDATQFARDKSLAIVGPAVFRIRGYQGQVKAFCTLKITPESFPPDKTLIIPDGTAGATVVLECSTNLINWSSATNGFYSGTNSAKFFRIRAERAP